jgi:predicted unusual protein kinase regulating ubiquinone biosynthesis (AarF/ABC1/UbiB family)
VIYLQLTSEIVAHLGNHGCRDVTDELNLSSCSAFPVANGGFGDVYRVMLHDGTQVAVKTMRLEIDSTNEGTKHLKVIIS